MTSFLIKKNVNYTQSRMERVTSDRIIYFCF